jgi:hypothetical protein
MEPLPAISKVLFLVSQQERQFHKLHNEVPNALSFANASSSQVSQKSSQQKQFSGNNSYKLCSHCKRKGHTQDVCYKLHGFPQGFNFKNPKYKHRNVDAATTFAIDDSSTNSPDTT